MNRRVARSVAVIGLLVMTGAPGTVAQTKNPCAAKNPDAVKGAQPGAAKNPCAAKNPGAAKIPAVGPSWVGSKRSTGVFIPGQSSEERLKSVEAR